MQQTRTANGTIMPLLMGCTQPSKIEMLENEQPLIYDPMTQSVVYDMRMVGTKSLRYTTTVVKQITNSIKSAKSDPKNEIDDSKNV